MATGRELIEAPLAASPRFGLLASIPTENVPEAVWGKGIEYAPEGCVTGTIFDPCDAPARTDPTKAENVAWQPYVLEISEKCSTFSGEVDEGRVLRLLNMDTERQLGRELWEGNLAQVAVDADGNPWPNTWLANVADVDILSESGAVPLVDGLACLEEYLVENNGGQQGVIHATAQTIVHWESFRLLRKINGTTYTMQDNIVIASPGYSGTDPNGNIGDSNVWAYATDMPRVYLGAVKTYSLEDSTDWENNTITLVAQRRALVEWQKCRHAGVRLDLELCDSGGS